MKKILFFISILLFVLAVLAKFKTIDNLLEIDKNANSLDCSIYEVC